VITDRPRVVTAPARVGETALLVLGIVGIGFRHPALAGEFTVFDAALGGLTLLVAVGVLAGHDRIPLEMRAGGLGLWLVLVGSLVASVRIGLRGWVIDELVLDLGTLLGAMAAITVMRRSAATARWAVAALLATGSVVAVRLLAEHAAVRARAGFPNPNIPGHLAAALAVLVLFLPLRRLPKLGLLALLLAGLVATGSFGAALLFVVGFLYWATCTSRAAPPAVRGLIRMLLVVAVLVAPFAVSSYVRSNADSEGQATRAYSADRFDRSSSSRLDIWSAAVDLSVRTPLGIGPGTARAERLLPKGKEVHTEPLSYLLERGPLGLVGLALFGFALWRVGLPGGPLRGVVVALGVSMLFRNVLHYRHVWVVLAVAAVLDDHVGRGTARSLLPRPLRARGPS
jgi:hypothetical protein